MAKRRMRITIDDPSPADVQALARLAARADGDDAADDDEADDDEADDDADDDEG